MMNTDVKRKLRLPDNLVNEMEIQEILHSPDSGNVHALIMLHDMSKSDEGYVIRTYMLKQVGESLQVDVELDAFAFPMRESAISFAKRLPSLTGIELLMIQNGYMVGFDDLDPYILQ